MTCPGRTPETGMRYRERTPVPVRQTLGRSCREAMRPVPPTLSTFSSGSARRPTTSAPFCWSGGWDRPTRGAAHRDTRRSPICARCAPGTNITLPVRGRAGGEAATGAAPASGHPVRDRRGPPRPRCIPAATRPALVAAEVLPAARAVAGGPRPAGGGPHPPAPPAVGGSSTCSASSWCLQSVPRNVVSSCRQPGVPGGAGGAGAVAVSVSVRRRGGRRRVRRTAPEVGIPRLERGGGQAMRSGSVSACRWRAAGGAARGHGRDRLYDPSGSGATAPRALHGGRRQPAVAA